MPEKTLFDLQLPDCICVFQCRTVSQRAPTAMAFSFRSTRKGFLYAILLKTVPAAGACPTILLLS